MTGTAFVNPATGLPYAFQKARVSGISAGVPGTLATWQEVLRRWTRSLHSALQPAIGVAREGFRGLDVYGMPTPSRGGSTVTRGSANRHGVQGGLSLKRRRGDSTAGGAGGATAGRANSDVDDGAGRW